MSIYDTAFSRPEVFFTNVTALKSRQQIKPEHCVDPQSTGKRSYAPGVGYALGLLLTGEMDVCQDSSGDEFTVKYQSRSLGSVIGISRKSAAGLGTSTLHWSTNQTAPFGHMGSACALTMVSGLLDAAHFPLTHAALRQVAALVSYPADKEEFKLQAENNPVIVGAIHYLSDALYTEGCLNIDSRTVQPEFTREHTVPALPPLLPAEVAKLLGVWREPVKVPRNTPKEQLIRLTRRGGAALLVGPPATFKTTTARKVAVAQNSPVVEMRGNPGVEDRDLFGSFLRAESGATVWVDGPLPQVFSHATRGPVVAIIDEILRFLPETTNVFITVLNQLDYEDCELLLRPALEHPALKLSPEGVQAQIDAQLPEKGERYHMLSMPNGDVLFALVRNITWIATTNWGESYLQVSTEIDPALLSRFDLIIDVPRADPEDVISIYRQVAGAYPDLARFAQDLEDESYEEARDPNSLFQRPLEPRKMIAFIKEAAQLLGEQRSFQDAVMLASAPTVVPHVCPREADGSLSEVSVARIYDIMTKNVLPNF